jgi:hypothetical protein
MSKSWLESGTLPSQSVRAWLVDSDDNDVWQLEGVNINAVAGTDEITFYLSCQYFESGNINVIFRGEIVGNLAKLFSIGNQHPRENFIGSQALSSLNSEVIIECDGCSSFLVDLRGTFSGTIEVSGTVNGGDWMPLPVVAVNLTNRLICGHNCGCDTGCLGR